METKRKRPPRLERPRKQYALDQCGLYGVRGIGQLIHTLNWKGSRQELEGLSAAPGSYKVWKNEKGRNLQSAQPELRRVQARIAVLLRRVLPPRIPAIGCPRAVVPEQRPATPPARPLSEARYQKLLPLHELSTCAEVFPRHHELRGRRRLLAGQALLFQEKPPANWWRP